MNVNDWRKYVKPTDGFISRHINRRISFKITSFIVSRKIPITPNHVSIISFLISIGAGIFYILKNPIIGGILVQLSSIIDGVDGELARVLGKTSRFGGFLDAVLDRIADIIIIATYAYFTANILSLGLNETLAVFTIVLTGDLLVSYIHARGEASLKKSPILIGKIPSFASRDVRLFIIFIGSIIGYFVPVANLLTLVAIGVLSYSYIISKTIDLYVHRKLFEEETHGD